MKPIGQAIREAREAAGMTQATLAAAVDWSISQLSLIEAGKRSISEDRVRRLEAALGIDDARLVTCHRWQQTPPAVRDRVTTLEARQRETRALAEMLREAARHAAFHETADPDDNTEGDTPGINRVLDTLLESGALRAMVGEDDPADLRPHGGDNIAPTAPPHDPSRSNRRGIPLINRVAAGYPMEFTDLDHPARIADEYVHVPEVSDPDAFAARVVGDSMLPEYREGEIVVFSPLAPTPEGSDCFIRFERDQESTFKRIHFEADGTMIRLQPLNPAYPARVVHRESIAGMYAAVYSMRRISPAG